MNALLGSDFETSLRILILLEAAHKKPLNVEEIAALDFITVYSSDFGITDSNLHGENKYRFGEYASSRELIKCAIKRLVLDGLINVSQTAKGFEYTLNQNGLEFMLSLNSEYADAYYETATQVLIKTRGKSGRALSEMINRCTIASLGGG
ncbi:ABC-three component system middle component 2 [Paradesulfitobacterium ferrireducens]|uniref:ABC-three component system middle component 2 n=1 Tax=Paradesulfitobacterium ferrireducens TaxID=2816476 RepID=UPI001A8D86E7|nr:ABC-three component system middle component 2 [Paradesulfitobacterium ferrireducens]